MLFEFASLLVAVGFILFVVGIFIARQYTLRSKLLTAFLVIALMSIGMLAVTDNYLMRESLTQSANKTLAVAAKQYANRVDQFLGSTQEAVATAARFPVFIEHLEKNTNTREDITTAVKVLNVMRSGHVRGVSYALLSPEGVNVLDSNTDNIGVDESAHDYFQIPEKDGGDYRSSIMFSKKYGAAIYFSSGIKSSSGKLLGVLRAQYNADVLDDIVKSARGFAGLGSFAILLDENMLRLVHGRKPSLRYTLAQPLAHDQISLLRENNQVPERVRLDYTEHSHWVSSVRQPAIETEAIVKEFYGLGPDLFTAAVARLNSAPWKIVFAQPQEIVLQPVIDQTSIALLLAGAVAVVVILLVLGTTQLLLGPVRRLTGVVQDVAQGRLQQKATVEADDEIGGLAGAFNTMTDNIQTLVFDLEKEVESHRLTSDHLRKLSLAIEQSPVAVMITDLDGAIEYVNPEFCRRTGYTEEEVLGENPRIISSGETPIHQYKSLWSTIKSGHSWHGELYNKKKNGELYWENTTISPIVSSEGVVTHYLAIKEDITQRKDYEEKLLYQATFDTLTDLPNRSLAFDRLQQAIAYASREKSRVAVLYLDFDHFKNINDTLGHAAGDRFLVLMADRLKNCVRDVDTVARLGGDEYLIILTGIEDHSLDNTIDYHDVIIDKTKEILIEVAMPCFIEDKEFSITASIGVSLYPNDGDEPHVLLRNADTAMYRSKHQGRNTVQMYKPEMNDSLSRRVEIEGKLLHALEEERFHLMYQPLVDAQTQNIIGAEALLRWNDDELGEVPPEVFVPYAEETGIIVDISNWVIGQACKDLKQWHEISGNNKLYNAINLSTRQFRDEGLVQIVSNAIAQNGLPGHGIELEITERMLMKDVSKVLTMLNRFKEMGILLSIDDFGTGYSSLSYLKRFPFDVMKIDRAFVKDIGVDPDDEALCDAVIAIGHSLGLKIIGEGVETKEQFDFLRTRGTEVIQGYYFSRPLLHEEFIEQIKSPAWLPR